MIFEEIQSYRVREEAKALRLPTTKKSAAATSTEPQGEPQAASAKAKAKAKAKPRVYTAEEMQSCKDKATNAAYAKGAGKGGNAVQSLTPAQRASTPCRFFAMPRGCVKGAKCDWLHGPNAAAQPRQQQQTQGNRPRVMTSRAASSNQPPTQDMQSFFVEAWQVWSNSRDEQRGTELPQMGESMMPFHHGSGRP